MIESYIDGLICTLRCVACLCLRGRGRETIRSAVQGTCIRKLAIPHALPLIKLVLYEMQFQANLKWLFLLFLKS